MKKLVVVLVVALGLFAISCTPEQIQENGTQQTDKDKVCPPGNPNC